MGRPSVALAQAIMFELTMRQSDVIGQWEPAKGQIGGIVSNSQRWVSGLVWQDINGVILEKKTSKTGATGRWVVSEYPLLAKELEKVPPEQRTDPMIIDKKPVAPTSTDTLQECFGRLRKPPVCQTALGLETSAQEASPKPWMLAQISNRRANTPPIPT